MSRDERQKGGMDLTWIDVRSRRLFITSFLVVEAVPLPEVEAHQGVLPMERMLVHVESRQFGREDVGKQ